MTLQELASVGFRNAMISYATTSQVLAVGPATGHIVTISRTRPAFGRYHATVTVYNLAGEMLTSLPDAVDLAFSIAFTNKMNNPNRG
jgi:hypothetical protein